MTNTSLYKKIASLPPPIQKEVVDYLEFLIQKHKKLSSKIHPKAGCMKGVFKISPDFDKPIG